MSWYRIGDDTYIDDSLVTCAEYQLFINEMRAQGKYYQPDHWQEYHFSTGQAREPILGVRPSDSAEFCEWLTARQTEGWRFRLPSPEEAQNHPVRTFYPLPIGYWTKGTNSALHPSSFGWIGSVPNNPRNLYPVSSLTLDLDHDIERARGLTSKWALGRPFKLDLDIDRAFARDLELDNRTFDRDLARARDYARELQTDRDSDRDSAISVPDFDNARDRAIDSAHDLYADFLTLRERIAGRSRAFEGIRLVRERII